MENLSDLWNKPLDGLAFPLPDAVHFILQRLEGAGYEAYLVGGAVRDLLLGCPVHDFDLCSSALPEECADLFSDYPQVLTGMKHGTVGIILNHDLYEITSFRVDGAYLDHRRPESVAFTRNLEEDVKRRDFTINALAFHPDKGLVDFVGGQRDLGAGCVRCVGCPNTRFTEDALRIMRVYRFSVQFGFPIEAETLQAARRHVRDLDHIARERIYQELKKMLQSTASVGIWLPALEVLQYLFPDISTSFDTQTASALSALPPDFVLRLTYLTMSYEEEALRTRLQKLTCSSAEGDAILRLHKALQDDFSTSGTAAVDLPQLVAFLYTHAVTFEGWMVLMENTRGIQESGAAFILHCRRLWQYIQAQGLPLTPADIAVNGHDLLALGFPAGKIIGQTLNELWKAVLREEVANTREDLLCYMRNTR